MGKQEVGRGGRGSVGRRALAVTGRLLAEGKQAVKMTRLCCHRFRLKQMWLALSLLAYARDTLQMPLA